MADTFANNARSSVANPTPFGSNIGLHTADLVLYGQRGDGGLFPQSGVFNIEIGPENASLAAVELAQCTSIAGDQLTLTRGTEGTTARDWPVGTPFRLKVTAADYTDIQADPSLATSATPTGAVTVAVPATTVATAAEPYHAMVYFLTAGVTTVITIDGVTVGSVAAVGTSLFVPAGSVVAVTYSVAPTWQWFVVR